jgi:hypothetical protein
MPNIRNSLQTLRSRSDVGLHDLGKIATPAIASYAAWQGYQSRLAQGMSVPGALALEAGNLAVSVLDPMGHLYLTFGVAGVRAATSAVIDQVTARNAFTQSVKTPFSHQFSHSDVTARAQQLGLQSIGAAWSNSMMASEAASFARRYGRR